MMARKRAQQRWSALLSRIDKQMRLEDPHKIAFVAHANAHYKAQFVAAFRKPMLKCVGPSYGDPCGFCVDLTSRDAFLLITCDMWKRAMPNAQRGGGAIAKL